MRSVILVCIVIAVSEVYGHTVNLDQSKTDKASQYATDYVGETGVKAEVLTEAKKGQLSEDEALKKFTLCFLQKADIVDQDGKLNIVTALAKMPTAIDKDETRKVLEVCKSKTGNDAADTVFEIYKCFRQKISTSNSLGV